MSPRRRREDAARGPRGTAKDRALGLLAVRWRSKDELRRRLLFAGFDPDEVAAALEDLERAGLVEDRRFAAAVVQDQSGRRLAGDRAIRQALRAKGVSQEVVEEALSSAGDELARATELASRRAARMADLPPEVAARRLFGLLSRRGYGPGVAREASAAALRDLLQPAIDPDPAD